MEQGVVQRRGLVETQHDSQQLAQKCDRFEVHQRHDPADVSSTDKQRKSGGELRKRTT